jgi:ABC-type branched-subunit amino acid transport system substrate-binding protein
MRQGIELAIEDWRAVLPGWTIEHVALDGGDAESGEPSSQVEASNARGAANDKSVFGYIGPYTSGAAMVSLPILNQAGLLQVLPVATWPGLTQSGWASEEPGRYYPTGSRHAVRLVPPDSAQARVAARKARELGAASALVLSDESDYSKGMVAAFQDEATRLGMTVVAGTNLSAATAEWTLPGKQVDMVFVAPSSLSMAERAGVIIAQDPPRIGVFATDVLLSDRLSEAARNTMEGWYVTFNGDPTPGGSQRFSEFAAKFHDRFGVPPSQSAINSYDVTAAVLETASQVGVDRHKILEAVLTGEYEAGVGGALAFEPGGDRQGGYLTLYRLVNGNFELLGEIEAPRNGPARP